MKEQVRDYRVEFIPSDWEFRQFKEAADFLGMNLSSFARQSMIEKSQEVIQQNNGLLLNNEDRDLFLNALENPPEINMEGLKNAIETYQNILKKKSEC